MVRSRKHVQNVSGLPLQNLEIKPHPISKLKVAGIESIFDLAIFTPHQLTQEDEGIIFISISGSISVLVGSADASHSAFTQ